MADLTITASSVVNVNGVPKHGIAGTTITAGQLVYKDAADSNKLKLVDTDAVGGTAAVGVGVALNGGATGQTITYQTTGDITIGATVAVGEVYVASGTAGGIAPVADLAAGDYTFVVGIGITTARIRLILEGGTVAKA